MSGVPDAAGWAVGLYQALNHKGDDDMRSDDWIAGVESASQAVHAYIEDHPIPVAPPCPEGRVRVEMSRDAAETAKGRAFAAVCQWQANGGYGLQIAKEIHEALRTALAKGAE